MVRVGLAVLEGAAAVKWMGLVDYSLFQLFAKVAAIDLIYHPQWSNQAQAPFFPLLLVWLRRYPASSALPIISISVFQPL